jgi:hypothetical protein
MASGSLGVCSLKKNSGSEIIPIAKKAIDPLEECIKKIPVTSITQVIEKAIPDIQINAGDLDPANTDKLTTDLWDLERKASALRSFFLNKVVRMAQAVGSCEAVFVKRVKEGI